MTCSIFELTTSEKQAIRLLEILALLHDIGKLTRGFIKSKSSDVTLNFDYQRVVNPAAIYDAGVIQAGLLVAPLAQLFDSSNPAPVDVRDILEELTPLQASFWDSESYSLADLILLTAPRYAYMTSKDMTSVFGKTMQPAQLIGLLHGVAHYEKEEADKSAKQASDDTFLATPFGFETPLSDLDEAYRKLPIDGINNSQTFNSWLDWLDQMADLMRLGAAETRRPSNEVSLWDWGFVVAIMAKAAAAQIFVNGWTSNKNEIIFRTLRVNIDEIDALTHSDKISDLLGVRQVLDQSYMAVRQLLEETYGFAARFYHDETGVFYLCPDFDLEESPLIAEIQAQFPWDLQPVVALGERLSAADLDPQFRGRDKNNGEPKAEYKQLSEAHKAQNEAAIENFLAKPRDQALAEIKMGSSQGDIDWTAIWQEQRPSNADICTVCRIRPVGYPVEGNQIEGISLSNWATLEKARGQNICRVCLDRRGRRSSKWLAGSQLDTTIWTDEVADNSGRLVLLTGQFLLDDWLNGRLVDTLLVEEGVTKNPSPVRLYRIAEEARQFWQNTIQTVIPSVVTNAPYRLILTPENGQDLSLGHGYAYELNIHGLGWQFTLNVVWDTDKMQFVSAENLAYTWRKLQDQLSGNEIEEAQDGDDWFMTYLPRTQCVIKEPSQFLKQSQEKGRFVISSVKQAPGYQPSLELMAEPGVAMFLIPATQALAVARKIKELYLERFGRVTDRLPLRLGLVYFRRRTPLSAVLDAGRRFLNMPSGWEKWKVSTRDFSVDFSDEKRGYNHIYPAVMGDGETEDRWYPNLLLRNPTESVQTKQCTGFDLEEHVWLRPSYYDYEYLDSAARRFEIAYIRPGQRNAQLVRPYLLQELDNMNHIWEELENSLETSQRHQVVYSIESTRAAWFAPNLQDSLIDDVFAQFVSDTLAGANWKPKWQEKPEADRQLLKKAGVSGQLADLAELYMEIMGKAD